MFFFWILSIIFINHPGLTSIHPKSLTYNSINQVYGENVYDTIFMHFQIIMEDKFKKKRSAAFWAQLNRLLKEKTDFRFLLTSIFAIRNNFFSKLFENRLLENSNELVAVSQKRGQTALEYEKTIWKKKHIYIYIYFLCPCIKNRSWFFQKVK